MWLEAKILRETNCDNLCNTSIKNASKIPAILTTGWNNEDDEKENGLGHMTDKPFTIGRKYVDSGFVHDISDRQQNAGRLLLC